MIFHNLHKEFSSNLGLIESNIGLGDFPRIQRGESLAIAQKEVFAGRPAYLKATKGDRNLMVYLKPGRDGVVTARVIPGLHYVTSHGLGRKLGTSDRLGSFTSILRNGFDSPTAEINVFLLTDNYDQEKWKSGYPVERNVISSYMGKDNAQDRGGVAGDSLRLVLWSGFVGFNSAKVRGSRVGTDTGVIWATPTSDLEGVVVTAPGSNWNKRVNFYENLYNEKELLAPIDVYDQAGRHVRIGQK